MTRSQINDDPSFDGSATYRILVQGEVTVERTELLGGLEVTSVSSTEAGPATTLGGIIRDQAQLNGVLDTLYNFHLTILSVERVPCESPGNGATSKHQ